MSLWHHMFPVPSLRPLTKKPGVAEGHRLVLALHITESTRMQHIKFFSKASSEIFVVVACLLAQTPTSLSLF